MGSAQIQNTRVCVIGLGYIGLPTAAVLATAGYDVHGYDTAASVVDTINAGRVHIVEPDLDMLVRAAVNAGRLKASTALEPADVFIICVPTPLRNGQNPDLSYVNAVADGLLPVLKPGNMVILESTVPVGTTQQLAARIEQNRGLVAGRDIYVAHCPERVLPGRILKEVTENDRIIGGVTTPCTRRVQAFYRSFVNGTCLNADSATAEMTKLVENSFRDVNIAFANELSVICHKLNVDVWKVIEFANRHPRVNILKPGPGVGGHCIAVDPWFIVSSAGEESRLIRAARQINDGKPRFILERARELIADGGLPLGILGLAFKADVDDFRESPALKIARALTQEWGRDAVLCHDPHGDKLAAEGEGLNLVQDLGELRRAAKGLLLLVDHREYHDLTPRRGQLIYNSRGPVDLKTSERRSPEPGSPALSPAAPADVPHRTL
jgi:UDP-N-acetyl-D-mannosaminuronic acid dehydrogenase